MLRGAIAALCREQVILEPFTSQDAYGNPAYGTAQTYRARVSQRARQVVTATGAVIASQTQVYLVDDVTVDTRDRITLPSPYSPLQPPILSVRRSPDQTGQRFTTVFC